MAAPITALNTSATRTWSSACARYGVSFPNTSKPPVTARRTDIGTDCTLSDAVALTRLRYLMLPTTLVHPKETL